LDQKYYCEAVARYSVPRKVRHRGKMFSEKNKGRATTIGLFVTCSKESTLGYVHCTMFYKTYTVLYFVRVENMKRIYC